MAQINDLLIGGKANFLNDIQASGLKEASESVSKILTLEDNNIFSYKTLSSISSSTKPYIYTTDNLILETNVISTEELYKHNIIFGCIDGDGLTQTSSSANKYSKLYIGGVELGISDPNSDYFYCPFLLFFNKEMNFTLRNYGMTTRTRCSNSIPTSGMITGSGFTIDDDGYIKLKIVFI